MAFFVEMMIIVAGLLGVFAGRNDCFGGFVRQDLPKIIRVIGGIGNQAFKFIIGNLSLCLGNVMALPSGQPKAQGVAQGIHIDMNFGAEPTAAPPQGLGGLPTLLVLCPSRARMCPDDRTIQNDILHIRVLCEMVMHGLPDPLFAPAGKPLTHAIPVSIFHRQQAPLGATPQDPEHAFQKAT
jgi:hypothetical protein